MGIEGGQQRLSHDRYQYDEILQLIVLEAMAAMEKTDETSDDSVCQYQWIHLAHTIVFSILHGNASLSRLLSFLKSAVSVAYCCFSRQKVWGINMENIE
jgi:hypothetical protein